MLFSSISFLYVFLPCFLVLYFLMPPNGRNYVLLLASLVFYAWTEPKFVFIMLAEILFGYLFGILIEKFKQKPPSKLLLGASLVVNLGLLGYFKYADFLLNIINQITQGALPLLSLALPVGISFYTFQIMSYTIDIYRGNVSAQKNPLLLAAYVAMFPQLIAGPIVRYQDIEGQIQNRSYSVEKIACGIRRFLLGLGKKVLIANSLGELCSVFKTSENLSVAWYWIYAAAFTLQIYYDFSGYSDMAIGLGKVLGFDFPENFNYPYMAGSITEFWRRWHMTLGSFFRDYVYIPLGGNRVPFWKWVRNIGVVWFLTGLWHGAAWNFIVWGLFFGILLLLEKTLFRSALEKAHIWNHIYVMLLVMISFVIFNASSLSQAFMELYGMIGGGGIPLMNSESLYYFRNYGLIFGIAIAGATSLPCSAMERLQHNRRIEKTSVVLEPVFLFGLLIVATAYLVDGSFNPFLYFRF